MNKTQIQNSEEMKMETNKPDYATKINEEQWKRICQFFRNDFNGSPWSFALSGMKYCSIATVNQDGTPHVTPVGSLFVCENRKGYYFEPYSRHMSRNFEHNQRVCVLVVKVSKWFWMKGLFLDSFDAPCAMRLIGTVGERRRATQQELARWRKLIRHSWILKGARNTWFKMSDVREIYFDTFEPIQVPTNQNHLEELLGV